MNSGYDCEGFSEVLEVGLRFRSRSILFSSAAVTLCGELASVQLRVESLRRQYRQLMARKRELGLQEGEEQTS